MKLDTWAVPFHDGPIQGFAIAGEDGRFQPANAGLPFDTQRNDTFSLANMYLIYTGKNPATPGIINEGEKRQLTQALKAEDLKRRLEEANALINQK